VAYFINSFPFSKIIKAVQVGLWVIFVPGGLEGNHGAAITNNVGGGDDFYTAVNCMFR
jgi:hypothetical protein